jgi:hypothetical protein
MSSLAIFGPFFQLLNLILKRRILGLDLLRVIQVVLASVLGNCQVDFKLSLFSTDDCYFFAELEGRCRSLVGKAPKLRSAAAYPFKSPF